MKTSRFCIVCIVCIVCISSIAPAQVSDDFSDGDFTGNPQWIGDMSQFEINSSGQLHLNSAGIDTSVLATRSNCNRSTEWRFWMKLSFNTSSNNHARVYLAADTSQLSSINNGYFLQPGGGADSLFIMKQTNGVTKIIYRFRSYKTFHSTNTLRFKITSDDSGHWEALIDTLGGYNFITDGTFFDDSYNTSGWFGIMCRYTSSNATKFYFDDFYMGPIQQDTLPPTIISQEAKGSNVVQITFSEPLRKESAGNLENFQIMSSGALPDSVAQNNQQPEIVTLFLNEPMTDGSIDSLHIRNILDLSGNRLSDTVVRVFYYQPKTYDILIHEIMADPDPPIDLPNCEYVELYNRSGYPINLEGWSFRYGSNEKTFPAKLLPSKGFLLIVKDSAYSNVANCAVLFSSSSSLSNEGTLLVLKDAHKHVIHTVTYSPDWFRGSFKEEGGWSLEMADPLNPCGCIENWEPSGDVSGGSPGRANSVAKSNSDDHLPVMLRAVIQDTSVLEVLFSEAMDSISLLAATKWSLNPEEIHPEVVAPVSPAFNTVKLVFKNPFIRGATYRLTISGLLKDCAGNNCDTTRSIRFAMPDSVAARDVVINEILSNPASGGARFVELYNRSEKIIDIKSLAIANRDTAGGFLENTTPLATGGYLLFPGDYVAFTSSTEDLKDRYRPAFPEAIAWVSGFPVFGDDTGTVILARKDNNAIIDRIKYNSDQHYPLLATSEGVSLERTNPDLPSDDQNNWHSAAETAGFATPGYRNSHWMVPEETSREIMLQPAIFSPDNDGRDDLLVISVREQNPDCAVDIVVYDARGRLVRQVANHVLNGSEGVFTWDGMTVSRTKAPMGFYLLLIELTWPDGTVRKIKKTAVLGGKF
jgi:hypothetical protein